jgi:hypothetical protein
MGRNSDYTRATGKWFLEFQVLPRDYRPGPFRINPFPIKNSGTTASVHPMEMKTETVACEDHSAIEKVSLRAEWLPKA